MLSVAKLIFHEKLKTLIKKDYKKSIDDLSEVKIGVGEAMKVINSNFEDKTIDIIKSLSLSLQVSLFSLYFSITSVTQKCTIVKILNLY